MRTKEIKTQLEAKLDERERLMAGKARITKEEHKRYDKLQDEILELRRLLYPKK